MKFSYKAQNLKGEVIEGVASAPNKFELARDLKKKNLTIIAAAVQKSGMGSFMDRINRLVVSVGMKEKIFFASNLSEMISAGLPLSRSLSVLQRQTSNVKMKGVIASIMADIDRGGSFSQALAKHEDVFSAIFVAMAEAGEKSGRLPEALKIVSGQMEKNYTLKRRIRGAMVYPAIVIIAMVLIAAVMLVYVVPALAETFADLGTELPTSTKFVIGASEFMANNTLILIFSLIILVYGLFKYVKTKSGKKLVAFGLLHSPVVKGLTMKFNSAITARTLSALISAGVEIVEALEITGRVVQNPYYRDVIGIAQTQVPKGGSLSGIFQDAEKWYPPFVGEMVSVGEETGKLSEMLLKLAIFYEDEVDAATKDLSTIIEPVIMIFVGAAVGFFAVSMIQPIYSIGTNI